MSKSLSGIFILLSLLLPLTVVGYAFGQGPKVYIVSLNTPTDVEVGKSATITVEVYYSTVSSLDLIVGLGSLDLTKNQVNLIQNKMRTVSGSGYDSVDFEIKASPHTTTISLTAIAVWMSGSQLFFDQADKWYQDFSISVFKYSTLTLTVNLPTKGVPVQAADQSVPTDNNGTAKFTVKSKTPNAVVSVTIPQVISVSSEERLRFVQWSDGTGTSERSFTIYENQTNNLSAEYLRQFLLSINSETGTPSGGGWYDEGTDAQISIQSTVPFGGFLGSLGGRYVFKAWEGDNITSSAVTSRVLMDSPRQITATWTTDYSRVVVTALVLSVGCAAIVIIVSRYGRSVGTRPLAVVWRSERRTARPNAVPLTTAGVSLDELQDPFTGVSFKPGDEIWQCSCSAKYHTESRAFIYHENAGICVVCQVPYQMSRYQPGLEVARSIRFRPEAITIGDAERNLGRIVLFEGRVVEVEQSKSGAYAVKFERGSWKYVFKLVILRRYVRRFSGGSRTIFSYQGRTIRVRGLLRRHPWFGLQILVNREEMIEVVN